MRSALIVLFTLAFVLRAQTPLGTVTGLAVDPSGGAVPGVSVTLSSEETGVKRTASTNGAGLYSFPDLPPGTYRLNAEANGFRPVETRAFAVEALRTVRQDLPLELATANSAVVVTEAASPVIQVDTPAIATNLASREIIELPTTLRSVAKNSGDSGLISEILPETVPGVVQVGDGAKWLTPGGTAGATDVKVDGIETRFGNFGSPDNVSQPSMEAIQEFTANVLTTRAEFARHGHRDHRHQERHQRIPRRRLRVHAQQRHRRAQHFRHRPALHQSAQLRRHAGRGGAEGQDLLLRGFRWHARRFRVPVFAQCADRGHA